MLFMLLYIAGYLGWSSAVVEMNCNLLENICSCMAVLCGQTLLHRSIITVSLKKFHGYRSIYETTKLFHLEWFALCSTYCHTQDKKYYSMKCQSLALAMCTVLKCKATESVVLCLRLLINMHWVSLAWFLTINIVVLTGTEQTKPNHSNPW